MKKASSLPFSSGFSIRLCAGRAAVADAMEYRCADCTAQEKPAFRDAFVHAPSVPFAQVPTRVYPARVSLRGGRMRMI